MRNLQRMIMLVLCLLLTVCALLSREAKAKPQDSQMQQNQSVVDAARRSRELKKNAAPPARVITNDDLDREHAKSDQEDFNAGALTAPRKDSPDASALAAGKVPDQAATLAGDESGLNNQESEEAAAEDAEIARLKAELASAQNSLYWQQRELFLDQNTIYSNPAYSGTHVGKDQLESAEFQIEETQQEIDRLKGPLANLEWRQWRRLQASRSESGSAAENYKSPPPSALVLPQP